MISKPKLHFLRHIVFYVRRFGPPLLYSTERYESFNHVFRMCSVLSNRQSPSHDICKQFGAFAAIKHVVTGGYWWCNTRKEYICASNNVLKFVDDNPKLAKFVGIGKELPPEFGKWCQSPFCFVTTYLTCCQAKYLVLMWLIVNPEESELSIHSLI